MTRLAIAVVPGVLLLAGAAQADPLREVFRESGEWLVMQRASQQRVEAMDEQVQDLDAEYQQLLRQIEGLEAYNRQLREQIAAQEREIARTDEAIAQATRVDRDLLPLLAEMVDGYARFIETGLPFSPAQRHQRLEFLRALVARADLSAAEKFRQVLDAWLSEMQYGTTIEAYDQVIRVDGVEREVTVLRLGRIALFWQTADRRHTGWFNPRSGQWEALGGWRNEIHHAIRVARKLAAPSLLTLPLPGPDAATENGS